MDNYLKVFISSTYKDLKEERQSAIDAILKSSHRPIGMEQFSSGDKSQIDSINDYLDKSDVFLLILGGRYGSIEAESGKSYIQLEYEYAKAKGMAMFTLVINDGALTTKQVKLGYQNVMELDNPKQYEEFKKTVLNYMCETFDDIKDIKYSIATKLGEIIKNKLETEVEKLQKEKIDNLKSRIRKRQIKSSAYLSNNSDIINYNAIKSILENKEVRIATDECFTDGKNIYKITNVLNVFVEKRNNFITGFRARNKSERDLLEIQVIPHLITHNLVAFGISESRKVARLTTIGHEFFRCYDLEEYENKIK